VNRKAVERQLRKEITAKTQKAQKKRPRKFEEGEGTVLRINPVPPNSPFAQFCVFSAFAVNLLLQYHLWISAALPPWPDSSLRVSPLSGPAMTCHWLPSALTSAGTPSDDAHARAEASSASVHRRYQLEAGLGGVGTAARGAGAFTEGFCAGTGLVAISLETATPPVVGAGLVVAGVGLAVAAAGMDAEVAGAEGVAGLVVSVLLSTCEASGYLIWSDGTA
jgi:hypothetical protein